jgi:hypothetical protein
MHSPNVMHCTVGTPLYVSLFINEYSKNKIIPLPFTLQHTGSILNILYSLYISFSVLIGLPPQVTFIAQIPSFLFCTIVYIPYMLRRFHPCNFVSTKFVAYIMRMCPPYNFLPIGSIPYTQLKLQRIYPCKDSILAILSPLVLSQLFYSVSKYTAIPPPRRKDFFLHNFVTA